MTKSQINLPKTAFSMKANLPTREPEILEYWKKINLYDELRNERGSDKRIGVRLMEVKGKRVVVTGAASGIGKALCEAFHKADVKSVVCVDLNIEGANETADSIGGLAVQANVGVEQDIIKVVSNCR